MKEVFLKQNIERALDEVCFIKEQKFHTSPSICASGLTGEEQRRILLAASANVCIKLGESPSKWIDRIQKRFGHSNDVRIALDKGLTENKSTKHIIDELIKHGFWGLSHQTDQLSLDKRTDIPSSPPQLECPVWAGISDIPVNINIGDSASLVTSAKVDLEVLIPETNRGAHMSRLQTAIEMADEESFADTIHYCKELVSKALKDQPAKKSKVTLNTTHKYPILSQITQVKSSFKVKTKIELTESLNDPLYCVITLQVGVMTACPCTLSYSHLRMEKATGKTAQNDQPPTFTHSQPGELVIRLSSELEQLPTFEEILNTCSSIAVFRESVLKRPDEHHLVELSHRKPQFTEDLARSAVSAVASILNENVMIQVEVANAESIHPHKAISKIKGRSQEFWRVIDECRS